MTFLLLFLLYILDWIVLDWLFHVLKNFLLLVFDKRLLEGIRRSPFKVQWSVFKLCVCKLRESTPRLYSFSIVYQGGETVWGKDKSVDDAVSGEDSELNFVMSCNEMCHKGSPQL